MKLDIISYASTFEEITYIVEKWAEMNFEAQIRIEQITMSMFEQYRLRLKNKFIPKIWEYRIICRNGIYYFGTI